MYLKVNSKAIEKLENVESQVLILKNQIGCGNRCCYLLNAFAFLLDYAYIVECRDSYRLLVKDWIQVVQDQRYQKLKDAQRGFLRMLRQLTGPVAAKPRWSVFFYPDEEFLSDQIVEMVQFRRRLGRKLGLAKLLFSPLSDTETIRDFNARVNGRYGTILADPPWRFTNRTGKGATEHKRLRQYPTLSLEEIAHLPVSEVAAEQSHLYLWVPNALIGEGLAVMNRWGFQYKTNLVWYKIRKDGGPDGRGVGFYFRNVSELVLFGIRGQLRTFPPARRQVNVMLSRKGRHSQKPEALYETIEKCSPGPYLELFARTKRSGWFQWGEEISNG